MFHFSLLAALLALLNVLGYTIASALFLNGAGAEALPLAYVLIGLVSLPLYGWFSQIVDRYSRPQLLRYALLVAIAIAVGGRVLLGTGAIAGHYLLFIFFSLQADLLLYILFPSLVFDYFTGLEYKRHAASLGMAQAIGSLVGGGLASLLAAFLSARGMLLCLPLLYLGAIAHLFWLERCHQPIEAPAPAARSGLQQSVKLLPGLMRRYPIVPFLVASTFIGAVLFNLAEFQYFGIYSQTFSDDRTLAGVLGGIRAANTAIQLVCFRVLAQPLLRRLGVQRANLIYPALTLLAFTGLWTTWQLPAAVTLHLSMVALYAAIAQPVRNLSYNAIPYRFVGRVRSLCDGLVFAVAQAAGGGLLLLCQVWLTPAQVTGVGVLFGAAMLVVHHFMGRSYTQSLMALLRSGSVNLNDVAEGTFRLPNSYVTEIRQLLNQSDRKAQQLGLELATRLENPGQFLTEIQALRSQVKNNPDLQWMALEIETKIAFRRNDAIALNAHISILKSHLSNPQTSPKLQQKCLQTLATIAHPGDMALGELAATLLHAPTPLVRGAAYRLLGAVRPASGLPAMVAGLKDLDPNVRQQAATAIAAFGEACLPLVGSYLQSAHPEVAAAAVSAIGQTRTKRAEDMLYHYLSEDLQQVAATLQWQAKLPADKPEFTALAIALADYHQRLIQRSLNVLSALGYSRTVDCVRCLLAATDKRGRANAVETLASLSHRRFILPLIPLLEQLASGDPPPTIPADTTSLREILEQALKSRDRWLQIGAILTNGNTRLLPQRAIEACAQAQDQSQDLLVRAVAQYTLESSQCDLSETSETTESRPPFKEFFMNRLLLLKQVALFSNLSLDELVLIDEALEQEEFLAGETIFTEGSIGSYFYILGEGNVRIVKAIDGVQKELSRLTVPQYFGEMALFDDSPRSASAIAQSDCTLLKLEKSRFISLIAQRPQIILEICKFLSDRVRATDIYRAR